MGHFLSFVRFSVSSATIFSLLFVSLELFTLYPIPKLECMVKCRYTLNVSVKFKTVKLPEENIGENHADLE